MSGMSISGVGNMSGIGNMTPIPDKAVVRYERIGVYRTSGVRGLTVHHSINLIIFVCTSIN